MSQKQNILVAPLDWGLGHTTRCIPIISYLLKNGHQVYAATSGASAQLLIENFPDISIIPLEGYNIKYAKSKTAFAFKILSQLPQIIKTIRNEHAWLQKIVLKYQIDAVISDNRYGLYHSKVKNVILTHQVQILSGMGSFADSCLRFFHRRMLEKFDTCWVVDEAKAPGLSGILAHPKSLPKNTNYLGLLSQFESLQFDTVPQKENQFLILLSGPEPMRTQLETLLWQQSIALTGHTFTFVAGKPNAKAPQTIPKHIQWYSHLKAAPLVLEILKAKGIICRSGYTTLMDLKMLQRPAILIPTPGQTEQEYLAQQLSRNNVNFILASQKNLDLKQELAKILYLPKASKYCSNDSLYQEIVAKWLKS